MVRSGAALTAVFGRASWDRAAVAFTGAQGATAPLTWGQLAILKDMRDSGSQFSMPGRMELPAGSTVVGTADRLRELMGRHAALRARLLPGAAGQVVAGSGEIGLDILTLPDDDSPDEVAQYARDLFGTWPRVRFDFDRDWPLRMAVLRHRGVCTHLVWVLSHLTADGGAAVLLLADLLGRANRDEEPMQLPDIARSEQEPRLRQLSRRTMRHWQTQLRHIPASTFGALTAPPGPRYRQVRFRSPATHLALLAIAGRTGTDVSRVTLAVIATAIGRVTGLTPVTVNVMINNRFRPGLIDVIAPVAQNSVVTIDIADTTVDAVVSQAGSASLIAGMRAYYHPDDLEELSARLDAERGYQARVGCRVNDQRTMIMRTAENTDRRPVGPVTTEQVSRQLAQTSFAWLEPADVLHVQANIIIENQPEVVSLLGQFDRWCLTDGQIEALVRGVEEVAVEAAFDPAAPTGVPRPATGPGGPGG